MAGRTKKRLFSDVHSFIIRYNLPWDA